MKKNVFFKSTIILLIGSLITKVFGFLIKIVFTRILGTDGISLYSLIMPTYSLVISLTQLGLPVAVSTLVSKGNKRGKKIIFSIVPVIMVLNLVMCVLVLTCSGFIATNLLHESSAKYPLMAISVVLPFISISSILRGYFFGKQNMMPHTISNIIEQLARTIIIITVLPKLKIFGITATVTAFVLLSAISELVSIVVFLIFLPKNFVIKKDDLIPDIKTSKEVLELCLPTVSGRIIGNVAYFFEPIILVYILSLVGYTKNFIITEYGIYNAYVIPLLIMPTFIVQAISTSLIPEISKSYHYNDIKNIKRKFKFSIFVTIVLSFFTNIIVFIFCKKILFVLYHTNKGINYIKVLAPFFILFNLEGPLSSTLQALGKSKEAFTATTVGVIIKTIVIVVLSLLKIGLYGLIIAEIIDILIVTFIDYIYIQKILQNKK